MLLRHALFILALSGIVMAGPDELRGIRDVKPRKDSASRRKLPKDKSAAAGDEDAKDNKQDKDKAPKPPKGGEDGQGYPFDRSVETMSCNGKNIPNGGPCSTKWDCISNRCSQSGQCECEVCNFSACGGCGLGMCCYASTTPGGPNFCSEVGHGPVADFPRLWKNNPDGELGAECACTADSDCASGCCINLLYNHPRCVCGQPDNPYLHCVGCPPSMSAKCVGYTGTLPF